MVPSQAFFEVMPWSANVASLVVLVWAIDPTTVTAVVGDAPHGGHAHRRPSAASHGAVIDGPHEATLGAVVKTFEETFEETLVNEDLETGSFAFDVLRQLRVGKLSRNLETCQCIVCRVLYTNSIQINLITPA